MSLGEVAERSLIEEGDFKFVRFDDTRAVFNDISGRVITEKLVIGYFRFSDKRRFSLKIGEQEIPFATVERTRRMLLPDKYKTKVEILPCMIPEALGALALHVLTEKYDIEKHTARSIQSVHKELGSLLENAYLKEKSRDI